MSKKAFTTTLVLLLILIAGFVWYFFFRSGSPLVKNSGVATSTNNLFPFGKGTGSGSNTKPTTNNQGGGGSTVGDVDVTAPRLRQLSLVPTAGVVAFERASSTFMRYAERATGHIYETVSDKVDVKKISNTTIPKIYEVLWSKDGNNLLIRYLKDDNETIRTFSARISTSTDADSSLEGLFLDDGIKDISVFGNKIFYFSKNSTGEQGIVANIDGSKKTSIFSSSYGDFSLTSSGNKFVTLYSRPSVGIYGSAYTLNTATGEYSKVLSDATGLSASANIDGSYVLGSGSNGGSITTSVFDVTKGTTSDVGVSTFIDKCIWSSKDKVVVYCAVPNTIPSAQYPDSWYKGSVSFSDSMWRIDVSNGNTEQVFDPLLDGESTMDMMSLGLDGDEKYLVFINKKDMTAWSYRLGL